MECIREMHSMKPNSEPENAGDPASEPPPLNFVILLLAAGSSSRMGQSKQLLDIDGMPLLRRSALLALASGASAVIVVLGANEQPHRDALAELPVEIVVNHYWKSGMGSSIKTGLHYIIQDHAEASAVLVMVCDQPELSPQHIALIRDHYVNSLKKIAASAYENTLGVPAMFGRAFFSNILMLRDDQGAKKIIDQFAEQVVSVPFPEGAVDLDTSDDYARYLDSKKV